MLVVGKLGNTTQRHQLMKLFLSLILLVVSCLAAFGQDEVASFADQIAKHRMEYKQGFLNDPRSPLDSNDLPKLRFFEPDEKYRVVCTFQRTPDEKPFELPTYSGITKTFVKYGVLKFELEGKKLELSIYQNLVLRNPLYAQHLFLPFRDATNADLTYGGGRYIDLLKSEVEGKSPVLDFNKCYNPWCHYSEGYNCPIPPVENTLELPILAGEKNWEGEHKAGK